MYPIFWCIRDFTNFLAPRKIDINLVEIGNRDIKGAACRHIYNSLGRHESMILATFL